jgi:hypothetical protein
MISLFSKEFELMCFVKDKSVLTGVCKFEEVADKFGDILLKKCIYEKKLIYIDKRDGGLEWTEFGRRSMGV